VEQLLEEVDASILVTDVHEFQPLAERVGPVELGLALTGYYGHVGGILERHGGRIVKFIGDGVLAAFVDDRHRGRVLAALAEMERTRPGWMADNVKVGLPKMDYSTGVASGQLLAGVIGTDRIRFWDVIGAPVNLAFKLAALAVSRRVPHLVDADTIEKASTEKSEVPPPASVEVDNAELGGRRHRLFKLDIH
jgi:adenylate cyclase